ncbi:MULTISPECIES: nitroreductase family protein [Lachnospiraceae]|uniref:nitroreductase family protein n=1 Tax=Lachnospiraceae TaxID=186803 RepID=UPI000407FDAA|nr:MULTISPECIES: nitroreductase family protein [Lachnospiraceae]MBP3783566.1 nitroreductase [Butyrivibrio sp.]MCU6732221.1 nitroreductase [Suonthocola fibrivorans]MDC7279356.1 nitroreductase [Butyrivibrio fibrisolvens]SCI37308.1 Nitroreductase family [uncultured Clostridium sp.]
MSEIDAIKERHSVRNYEAKKIEADKVEKIRAKIEELNKEGNLHLQFMEDAGKTYNKLFNKVAGLGSAPSVIACVGIDDETLEQRVGYYGEKLVLFIQELGLNTCWAGTFNQKNIGAEVGNNKKLVISIAVGYGKDKGKPHKSKSPEQVIEAKGDRPYWFNKGVDMALLAPTAINQQKFTIRLNEDESVDFVDKGGIFSQVDLGIVRCHFEIGAEKSFPI